MIFRIKIVLLLFLLCVESNAQILQNFCDKPLTIQVGWNIIDDNAQTFRNIFNPKSWYSDPLPGKISAMKTLRGKLKSEIGISLVKMSKSYYKDRYLNPGIFSCVDFNFRVQFNLTNKLYTHRHYGNQLNNFGINISPIFGIGYTNRTQTVYSKNLNLNVGGCFTLWILRNKFGLNLQSLAKFGLQKSIPLAGSNYFHHSIGITYVARLLSKKQFFENRFNL